MSSTSSTYLPDWTIGGADVHTALPGIVSAHGSSAVIIGGRRAMAAAEPRIRGALEGSPVSVTGSSSPATRPPRRRPTSSRAPTRWPAPT